MHRGWQDKPIFSRETFSRRDAWVWLIEHAAFRPTEVGLGKNTIAVGRGQLCYSLRYLARAWGWDDAKVRRFISRAIADEMITCVADAGQSLITIRNYEAYQNFTRVGDASTDADATQARRSSDANKKEGNNLDSEPANAGSSGADAPPIAPPIDLKAQIFGPIRAWLVASSGRSESSVRSWLGRCCGEFNDGNVIDAATRLMAAPATNDPFSSLKKELQRMGQHGKSSKPSAADNTRDIRSGLANALLAQELGGGDSGPCDDRTDLSGAGGDGEIIDAMRSEAGGYDDGDDARVVQFAR